MQDIDAYLAANEALSLHTLVMSLLHFGHPKQAVEAGIRRYIDKT